MHIKIVITNNSSPIKVHHREKAEKDYFYTKKKKKEKKKEKEKKKLVKTRLNLMHFIPFHAENLLTVLQFATYYH
jgi:hypothetical protein